MIVKRKIEVIDKDITSPKLTVATDRITIKFPIGYDVKKKKDLSVKLLRVAEKIGIPEFTLRGRVSEKETISMQNQKKEVVCVYDLNNF